MNFFTEVLAGFNIPESETCQKLKLIFLLAYGIWPSLGKFSFGLAADIPNFKCVLSTKDFMVISPTSYHR